MEMIQTITNIMLVWYRLKIKEAADNAHIIMSRVIATI